MLIQFLRYMVPTTHCRIIFIYLYVFYFFICSWSTSTHSAIHRWTPIHLLGTIDVVSHCGDTISWRRIFDFSGKRSPTSQMTRGFFFLHQNHRWFFPWFPAVCVEQSAVQTTVLINHFSLFKSALGSYAMNNTGK